MKTNRKISNWLWPILALVIIAYVAIVVLSVKTQKISVMHNHPTLPINALSWTTIHLDETYPPNTATNNIVRDTLGAYAHLKIFLNGSIAHDRNLIKLISDEQSQSVNEEQFETDLSKLRGMNLDLIGQWHDSLDSDKRIIIRIQSDIAQMIRGRYDVMWSEDFTGGNVITRAAVTNEIFNEKSAAELLIPIQVSREEMNSYIQMNIPLYASFQFVFDSKSGVEVRGADYMPVKDIQQHLMAYAAPPQMRRIPVPYQFTLNEEREIMRSLGDLRDLYILRHIALKADRTKRNVLVLGSAHIDHITYAMAKYGVRSKVIFPKSL